MNHSSVGREGLDSSPPAQLPAIGYVRLPTICAVTGLARSTVWAWVRGRRFPAPIKLSARATAWSVTEVRAWLTDPTAWQAANKAEG
ncbi:helix-turn-helix transcriptional regulator [Bordetella hinzii]|uniref:helix-turn-helix transcriptional regulator n=1 Tax=Bordetella hinzii TaxID=103855 RepID=UPI0009B85BCD|nr:AlpA family phage regulatory protein [Bordetella hinzii]